jgi:hypothetical protein
LIMKQFSVFGSLAALLFCGCNAALTTVTNWGNNPTNLEMQIYLPKTLAAKPPVVVAVSIELAVDIARRGCATDW